MLLLWLAACGAALAQEAPPCPCPEPPPPPDPLWFGKVNFSFLSTSGNTDTTSIGGAAEVNYNPKPFLFTLKGAYLYSQTDGDRDRRVVGGVDARQLRHHAALLRLRRRRIPAQHVFGHRLPLEHRRRRGLQALRRPEPVPEGRRRRGLDEREGHHPGRHPDHRAATPTRARRLYYKWQFTKNAAFTNDFTLPPRPRRHRRTTSSPTGRRSRRTSRRSSRCRRRGRCCGATSRSSASATRTRRRPSASWRPFDVQARRRRARTRRGFAGHPRGLAPLFFTEVWERFSYYGMRAILVLYMVAPAAQGGLGFDTKRAASIYGTYTMAVYPHGDPGRSHRRPPPRIAPHGARRRHRHRRRPLFDGVRLDGVVLRRAWS